MKWKHLPLDWPFVRGIHRSPVNSLHKGQWRGALMFSLICVWIIDWVNNREAGDLRCYHAHYGVIVMLKHFAHSWSQLSRDLKSSTIKVLGFAQLLSVSGPVMTDALNVCHYPDVYWPAPGLILGLCPANEKRRYFVTTSLIGWAQT